MSASLHTVVPGAANPLDILEQIVTANDWVFDRRTDEEMAAVQDDVFQALGWE